MLLCLIYLELKDSVQVNKDIKTVSDNNNLNIGLSSLKKNDTVYLKHFEDTANVYIVKDVKLFNEVMSSIIKDKGMLVYYLILS